MKRLSSGIQHPVLFTMLMAFPMVGVNAQSFTTTMGGPYAQDAVGIVQSGAGALVGSTVFNGTGHRGTLLELNAAGNAISEVEFDVPGAVFLQAMIPSQNGGGYIVGSMIPNGAHEHDGLLVRVGSGGTIAWTAYPSAAGDQQYHGATLLPNGDIIVCGISRTDHGHDALVARFDALGEMIWSDVQGDLGDEEAYAVAANADGIMVTGRQVNFGGTTDALFLRYALDGTLVWSTTWGGVKNEEGRGIIAKPNGNFTMVGTTTSFGTFDVSEQRIKEHVYVIDIDSNGDTLWTRAMGDTLFDRSIRSVDRATNGELILGGVRRSLGETDGLLMRCSDAADPIWERAIDLGNEERILCVRATSNGLLATGWAFGSLGRQQLLLRRNANGD